ncbi:MAG: hypothetical protein WCY27_00685 [archaeon]|jgi:hypothetical protein|nr:hypothetical protein [archaeon]MDD3084502.1 hypothetical protein [Candidatus ainarchaeum sp.]MDD4220783.1 hypothetical protein [Candidatus ainarchaeum sp.]MDD4662282.1 hypothetical protein [Candidatus ainarchaeum sp.]
MKLVKHTERGQAFEVYRLLIAFIIAVAVMSIIIVMVQKTNKESILLSYQNLEQGFISATKSPGTSSKMPFVIEDLKLKGMITKKKLSTISGLKEECIIFDAGPGIEKTDIGVEINKILKFDTTVYCNFGNVDILETPIIQLLENNTLENCPVYCIVFMNKNPKDIYP